MGRLIDTDVLLARIRLNYNEHQNINAAAMKDIIDTTKTAYDVGKVVAELEEAKFPITDLKQGVVINGSQQTDDAVLFNRAIDIVRKGGVE